MIYLFFFFWPHHMQDLGSPTRDWALHWKCRVLTTGPPGDCYKSNYAVQGHMSKRNKQSRSRVQVFVTLWNLAHQAPLSMGISRQEHWRGLPFPPPRDLPTLGLNPGLSHCRQTLLSTEPPGKPCVNCISINLEGGGKKKQERHNTCTKECQ